MHIRAGYEIAFRTLQPTPIILMLTVHPSRDTRRSACPSKPLPTRTRYLPATSISTFSATIDGCATTASCSAVIITGIS
jgi:hypothetical protein